MTDADLAKALRERAEQFHEQARALGREADSMTKLSQSYEQNAKRRAAAALRARVAALHEAIRALDGPTN